MTLLGPPGQRVSRRSLLGAGAAGSTIALGVAARPAYATAPKADPFLLGVASGDPGPFGVTLWTRLATDPLTPDGGMGTRPLLVSWEVALDERMRLVVRRGLAVARPDDAHSVHVDLVGLLPDRVYYYRFRSGGHVSTVGRTRTFPFDGARVRSLSFAAVSCQNLPAGRYAAYRHLAEQEHDVVLHLGDYIYESAGAANPAAGADRKHAPFKKLETLEDYRIRHAQYRLDPDLQAAHASAPWIVVPDDHEVTNNFNVDTSPTLKANGFRAYWEHMPLPASARPKGSRIQLFRSLDYGALATFDMLDTRQYRSPQLTGPTFQPLPPEAYDPARTMMGAEQEAWLFDRLDRSRATWNVLAQQIYLAAIDVTPGEASAYNTDKWDGYPVARNRLTGFLGTGRVRNPVVLAGDVHAAMVNDVTETNEQDSPIVATEFLGSSVTTGKDNNDVFEGAIPENPEMLFYNGRQRGYLSCEVTRDTFRGDLWFVDDILDADSPVRRQASYVVEDGRRGGQPA